MNEVKTIALGQGGGPTPVINDSLAGAIYEAGLNGVPRIYGLMNGLEGLIDPSLGNVIDITNWNHIDVRNRPGAVLGTTRIKLKIGRDDKTIAKIKDNLNKLGIEALVYFGGNDSAYILQALGNGIRVVHGAKTADNDLPDSHHTPGFGSAALYNARAVKTLTQDFFSYGTKARGENGTETGVAPVVIYQTMGRDTGWLALATAFARCGERGYDQNANPDIILIPEIEFKNKVFLEKLDNILVNKSKALVVVGEGVWKEVSMVKTPLAQMCGDLEKDEHDHAEFGRPDAGSAAEYIAEVVKNELKIKTVRKIKSTAIIPQHLQRCYERSSVDAVEAFEVGQEAVNAVLEGDSMKSVVLQNKGNGYGIRVARVPMENIAGKIRYVPEEFYEGISGPTSSFISELIPTIGGVGRIPTYKDLDFSRIVRIGN